MHNRTSSYAFFVALVCVAWCTGCATNAHDQQVDSTEKALRHPPAGVENFGVVTEEVWRGAKPNAEGWHALAKLGVKTVIDLQEIDESGEIPAGIRYVSIRTSAWYADQVDTAKVLAAIAECPKPVFIHCAQGRDRTGLAVAAYSVSKGMKVDDVVAELSRFNVNFWWRRPIENRIRQLSRAERTT